MLTFTLDIDYAHSSVLREISNIRLIIDSLEEKFKEELKLEEEEELLKKLRCGRTIIKKRQVGLLELPDIKEEEEEDDEEEVKEVKIADIIAEEKKEEKKKEKKITCPCGGEFVSRNKKRHENTKTHVEYLKINNIK